MKIAHPTISAYLTDGTLTAMINDGELEDVLLQDVDAANSVVVSLELSGVRIERTLFTGAHLSRVMMRDVSVKQSDLTSTHLDNGVFVRNEFINCRLTGADFSQASIHDAVFRGCKLDVANFRQADLRRVQFVDCILSETDFINATLTDVEFQLCTLEKTIFSHSNCKKVDLRTSQLSEIAGWRSLKGATIDTVQLMNAAPYLAQELGIIVRHD